MNTPPPPPSGRRARRAGAVCAITALLAVTVAACSQSSRSAEDPASPASSASTAPFSSGTRQQRQGSDIGEEQYYRLLAYSKCMRSHGVKDFPDPTRQGLSPLGVDRTSSQYQSADRACHSLAPYGPHASAQPDGGS